MVESEGKNSSSHVKLVPILRGALGDMLNISRSGNDSSSMLGLPMGSS